MYKTGGLSNEEKNGSLSPDPSPVESGLSSSTSLRGCLLPRQSRLNLVREFAGLLRVNPRNDEKRLNSDNLTALPRRGSLKRLRIISKKAL